MNFFTKLFKKKAVVEISPMPSWETVVEMMYDKHLDTFSDEVVKVVYSKDRSILLPQFCSVWLLLGTKKATFVYRTNVAFFELSVPCGTISNADAS